MDNENPRGLLAPAKINLRLEVLDKRKDGYHEIRSIMCLVGLFDVLSVSPSPQGITITSNSSKVPLDSNNLVYRSASLLIQEADITSGLNIYLEKNIPVAAGLGGGSSDAAAGMKGINELFDLHYSPADLMRLGAQIGADVPFFFSSGPALATGIGDKLASCALSPAFWVLLVTPPITVSTGWAYSQFSLSKRCRQSIGFPEKIDLLKAGQELLYNDLEKVVIPRFPEIRDIKKILVKLGAWGSLMSGSGSTVFGVFFEEPAAKEVENKLRRDYEERNWSISLVKALL